MNAAEINALAKAIAREVVRELTAFAQIVEVRPPKNVYNVGPFTIDLDRHEVTADGEQIYLKPREFELFAQFARNAGLTLSRERLLELAWPADVLQEVDNNRTVDVHVLRIRQRLGKHQTWLETVPGYGYKLRER
jgi:two-component system alkaline phosphatase synthesis response regulator PhoP